MSRKKILLGDKVQINTTLKIPKIGEQMHEISTLTLQQAANFLGIHPETLRQRAASGELPGAKVGKSWRFLEIDLISYLRSLYTKSTSQVISHGNKKSQQEKFPINNVNSSPSQRKKEYYSALGVTTK